jgi:hypothetical protein
MSGILSPHSRVYFVTGMEDPFRFWDAGIVSRIVEGLKSGLLQKLERYRLIIGTEQIKSRYVKNLAARPNAVMKLCLAADLFGLRLDDFLAASELLKPTDLDNLAAEVREARSNTCLAYPTIAI